MGRYVRCAVCDEPIYYEDAEREQDDAYEIEDGEIVCEDCVPSYVRKNYYKVLKEDY